MNPLNAEFQRIARREKKAFLSDQCKEIKENDKWERLEMSSRQLERKPTCNNEDLVQPKSIINIFFKKNRHTQ